ncbi:MAG TPA: DUF488 domain-containing protein [Chitinispirillaceae bacterium]|jgi:uncharacterized protein (DUF488 family)|nr:DUF488 domain-containing protein [Chitinispirillaceae bacterium]
MVEGEKNVKIWTIGHSTRMLDDFIDVLRYFDIALLVDVRSYPGSRKNPQFNKEILSINLPQKGIEYKHSKNLGGRRKSRANSKNLAWRNPMFRGYADYMESETFLKGINDLMERAYEKRTVIMCSELLWWRCHRSMIADYLKVNGFEVIQIFDKSKVVRHPFTSAAKVVNGKISYVKK